MQKSATLTIILVVVVIAFLALSNKQMTSTEKKEASSSAVALNGTQYNSVQDYEKNDLRTHEPVRPLYEAATFSELELASNVIAFSDPYGSRRARSEAHVLCNYLHGGKYPSFLHFFEAKGGNKDAIASARYLDGYRRKFCNFGTDQDALLDWGNDQAQLIALAESSQNPELRMLITAMTAMHLSSEDIDNAHETLATLRRNTDSPAIFFEATQTLSSETTGLWDPDGFDSRSVSADGGILPVKLTGSLIAYCRLTNECSPTSLITVRMCMPDRCVPGMSVTDYLRMQNSPAVYSAASEYADALLRERNKDGGS